MGLLKIRHSREGGNPAVLFKMLLDFVFAAQRNFSLKLDSRLRGNDAVELLEVPR
jgi:hypothetical protein